MLRRCNSGFSALVALGALLGSVRCIAQAQESSTSWLLDRSWSLINENLDSAFYYADVGAERARAEGDSARLALAFRRIAVCLERQLRPEEALRYLQSAWSIDDRMGNERALISTEQKIGTALTSMGRQTEAIPVLERAIERSIRIEDKPSEARCLNQLAMALQSLGRFEQAIAPTFEALRIRKALNDPSGVAQTLNTLAGSYWRMGRLELAEQTLKEQIAMFADEGQRRERTVGMLNLGVLYNQMGRGQEQLAYADSVIAICRDVGDALCEQEALIARANALETIDRKGEARVIYEQVIRMAEEAGNEDNRAIALLGLVGVMPDSEKGRAEQLLREILIWSRSASNLNIELSATDALADNLRGQGKANEALTYYERARVLVDSLYSKSTGEAFANADQRERYDASLREEQIEELQLELALQEEQRRRRTLERDAMILASIGLVVLVLLALRTLQQRRRIMRQQIALHENQVRELMSEQEVVALEAMLDGQRSERERIAQDLHDRLGSAMSAIRMRISTIDAEPEADVSHRNANLATLIGMADDAVADVRRIAHDLADNSFARGGLGSALEGLRDRLHQPGKLEVDASIHGFDKRIVQKVEMTLYKVVLELVANVLKHARASRLTLDAVRDDDSITIIIEDDGQGFVEANSKAGLGLKGVRERVASIGGSVRWESSPGRGTTVVVDVPLGSD